MSMSRVLSRASRSVVGRAATPLLLHSSQKQQLPILSSQIHSFFNEYPGKFASSQVSLFHHSAPTFLPFNRFGFTSSASPEPSEKEQRNMAEENSASSNGEAAEAAKTNEDSNSSGRREDSASGESKESGFSTESKPATSHSVKRRRRGYKRTAFSDSDMEVDDDLSRDELVKLVAEKEDLLNSKHKEVQKMQDKVLRTLAEMENVMERTKREAENSKKFAIQNFAKSLLDVADNIGRASSVVKVSFSKIDTSIDTSTAVPLLKTLLEGVEMTEKQLAEVFKKYGIEKFDPTNEPFDPHKHNAAFQIPDSSKPAGTVAAVLKPGYMLHDRIIRPAEVGVTHVVETETHDEGEKTSDA